MPFGNRLSPEPIPVLVNQDVPNRSDSTCTETQKPIIMRKKAIAIRTIPSSACTASDQSELEPSDAEKDLSSPQGSLQRQSESSKVL